MKMRKYFSLILVLFPQICSSLYLSVNTSKDTYLRYEIVEISAAFNSVMEIAIQDAKVEATVYFSEEGKLVTTVGDMESVPLQFNEKKNIWGGYWPPPWNPELGRYTVVVSVEFDGCTIEAGKDFFIQGKKFEVKEPLFIMTIETMCDLLKYPVWDPERKNRDWTNFTEWAESLGANTILYSAAQTIAGKTRNNSPWVLSFLKNYLLFASYAKKKGFRFGCWIGSFRVWGENFKRFDYDFSWEYRDGKLFQNRHISFKDKKRIGEIADLFKVFNDNPDVDYIGLDYIRSGQGGLEFADDFVREMSVDAPKNWEKFNSSEKMRWLGSKVKGRKESPARQKWEWWRAHKSAETLAKIVEISKPEKPIFVFMLAWDKGHEHGQDPIMMNDAGASFVLVMLYESEAEMTERLFTQWSNYLKGSEVNLIPGQVVDWVLLDEDKYAPAPEEFYIRLTHGIKGMSSDELVKGLFWHDLSRINWCRIGPYHRREWVTAGAASFSNLKSDLGILPVESRFWVTDESIIVNVTNRSPLDIENVSVRFGSEEMRVIDRLEPFETKAIPFNVKGDGMFSCEITIPDYEDRYVDFLYLSDKYAEKSFREPMSPYAGGDILFIYNRQKEASVVARLLKMLGYDTCIISPHEVSEDILKKYDFIFTDTKSQYGHKRVVHITDDAEFKTNFSEYGKEIFIQNGDIDNRSISEILLWLE